jgi:hypothetical protein
MPRNDTPTFEQLIHQIVARAASDIAAAARQDLASEIQRVLGAQAAAAAAPAHVAPAVEAAPVAAAPAAPVKRRGRPPKAAQKSSADDLFQFISEHPGLTAEKIAKQLGTSTARLKTGLAALVTAGKVARGGKARGTNYTATSAAAPSAPEAAEPAVAAAAPKAKAAPTKKAAPVKKAKRETSKRRLITDAELGVVLDALKKSPGLTSVEIQRDAGIDAKQAARVLNKLRETKKVKWKGERSAAKYTVA